LENHLDVSTQLTTYNLALNEFKSPVWWYQVNNISESELPAVNFSQTKFISIQNCTLINQRVSDTIVVKQFSFLKDHTDFYQISLLLSCCYCSILALVYFIQKRKPREWIINYSPLETTNIAVTEEEKVTGYLSKNYHDPELGLEKNSEGNGNC